MNANKGNISWISHTYSCTCTAQNFIISQYNIFTEVELFCKGSIIISTLSSGEKKV